MLRAENICKKYFRETDESNYFTAVEPVSFELKKGSLTVLMGRSGSGKSTLLSMLAGLLTPSEGKIYVNDTDIYSLSDKDLSVFRNKNIGVIPQGYTALFNLTCAENIMLPAGMHRGNSAAEEYVKNRTRELMKELGIYELRKVYPAHMSGGEMRRMAIARGIINDPGLILADEPTGDLDDENTALVFRILRRLADDGAAVLVVTHEESGREYADECFKMTAGEFNS